MWDICLCTLALLSPTMSQPRGPRNSSDYQITERIDDIPDNRTLAPIDPTYGIQVPLNFGNNTVLNIVGTTTEHIPITNPFETPGGPVTESKPDSVTYEVNENRPFEKPDQSNNQENKTNVKKNSFSILHIKGEFDNDDKVTSSNAGANNNAGFKSFLDGLRTYLYSMKKGLVDGLYHWYHKDQARKEIDKFYRSFNKNDDDDDEKTSDNDVRNWIHRNEVQKEINDFYKNFSDDSGEESEFDGPDGDKKVADVPKVDESEPGYPVTDDETEPGHDEFKPNGPDSDEESDEEENETNDDEIDIRFGEQHSPEYDHYDDYDHHHHHHHGRHRKFGDCK